MRFIGLKVMEEDYEDIQKAAAEEDRSSSALIRHIILTYIRKWKEEKRLRK